MDLSKSSTTTPNPPTVPTASLPDDKISSLAHPPSTSSPSFSENQPCSIKPITFKIHDDRPRPVRAFLHIPHHFKETSGHQTTAALLLSGAEGGLDGPSSLYPSLADTIANTPQSTIPVMRLAYRHPAQTASCIADVLAGMTYLSTKLSISRFVLVGWSFGGSLVAAIGGSDERVVGCAMVASQLAGTEGVGGMAPRPLLLVHGTGDRVMRSSCSEELWEGYGEGGERRLVLVEGGEHGLGEEGGEVGEMVRGFVVGCAGEGGRVERMEEEG